MKTIVVLTDQLYKIGGINSLIPLKANYWSDIMNYDVHIVTTEQEDNQPFYPLSTKVIFHDLGINYDRTKSYFDKVNFSKVIENLWLLRKLLKSLNPHLVIIANQIPATLFFPLIGTKAKILREYHNTKFFQTKEKPTLLGRFKKYIDSKVDFQVVLSEEEKSFYDSDRSYHIPNPIPFSILVQPISKGREMVAMAAGRISPVKRFDVLLNIWSDFKKSDSTWKLEIYGEGLDSDVESLKSQIITLGLSESVKILNPVNNLPEVMRTKGLYLMTSAQECFPMVLLEAQASGLPIVSFNCPTGPRNIIESGKNGVLVEMDNQKSFVQTINHLVNDEPYRLRLGNEGYHTVQRYLLNNVMKIWDDKIIKQIL